MGLNTAKTKGESPIPAENMDTSIGKPPLLITLIAYSLGIAALLPWNFFITADSFWQYKLRNVTLGEDWDCANSTNTSLQVAFMPTLVILSNIFCTLCLVATTWIVTRVSEQLRVSGSLVVMIITMLVVTVLAIVQTDTWQTGFYVLVMVMVAVLNMFEAVFQGSLYGIVGQLPSACTNSLVSGMAIAGVFSSLAEIISLAIGEADPIRSGIIYFVIADVFLILALTLYYLMRNMDFYKDCIKASQDKMVVNTKPKSAKAYWIVFKKIWWQSFTVGIGLLITLAVFPAVHVYVTSTTPDGPWKDVYFQPTITFLLYNVGDVMGRELTRWVRWPGPRGWKLPGLSLSRVLLVLLIMFCYGEDKTFPTLFNNDAWYIIFNLLFGVSNGYVGCLPFIYYPDLLEAEEVELGGTIMGAMMGTGSLLGALLSPALVALWGPKS